MDGVEQPLLLERFPEALNHAGPVDALACQGASRAVISSRNFWAMGEWVTGERCLVVVMALSSL
jgi:hypothetical protein